MRAILYLLLNASGTVTNCDPNAIEIINNSKFRGNFIKLSHSYIEMASMKKASMRQTMITSHIHHVPGRLRLKFSPPVDSQSIQTARSYLSKINGVSCTSFNSTTRSLIVWYQPGTVAPEALVALVNASGHFPPIPSAPTVTAELTPAREQRPVVRRPVVRKDFAAVIVSGLVSACLERGTAALIAAIL